MATSPTPTPTPTQPDTRAAAVDAFRLWVKQFNAEQWDKHYATMVSAQQKIITAKRYAACKNKQTLPTFKWISTVSTKPNVKTRIPGTSVTKPATVVTARLRVSGYTLPVPAHMFYENGQWRWSMTMENVKGCKA